jgi:hypothetical protein
MIAVLATFKGNIHMIIACGASCHCHSTTIVVHCHIPPAGGHAQPLKIYVLSNKEGCYDGIRDSIMAA